MACPHCGAPSVADIAVALTNDGNHHTHVHSMAYGAIPVHDQGQAYFAREHAVRSFWERIRQVVREELEAHHGQDVDQQSPAQ